MSSEIGPAIREYLTDLEGAVAELANTWHPDDPAYRADVYRQTMMSLSYSYFAYFHATPEHPDWAPLWNPVFRLQPNPDDIYLYSPIRGDLRYRVSGNRGTIHILSFTTQRFMSGMVDDIAQIGGHNDLDDQDIVFDANGDFELIFSVERPAGYTGNWAPIHPEATGMMVRLRSYDWVNEIDPTLSIECLDAVPPKPRLAPEAIIARIREMAKFPARKTRSYYRMQNAVKERVGFNVFEPIRMKGALTKQVYWPACFQLEADEALIIETRDTEACTLLEHSAQRSLFQRARIRLSAEQHQRRHGEAQLRRQAARSHCAHRSGRTQLARSGGLQGGRHLWPLV